MNGSSRFTLLSMLVLGAVAAPVHATPSSPGAIGYVTPTRLSIPITSIQLMSPDGAQVAPLATSGFTAVFSKRDGNLVEAELGAISIPFGRWGEIGLGFGTGAEWSATVDHGVFHGDTLTGAFAVADGAVLTSVAGSARNVGALSTNANATAGELRGLLWYDGNLEASSRTIFAKPICITDDTSICKPGDKIIDVSDAASGATANDAGSGGADGGADGGAAPPSATIAAASLHLVIDLQSWLSVYDDGSVRASPVFPLVSLEKPGAAVHLFGTDTRQFDGHLATTVSNVGILFGASKTDILGIFMNTSGGIANFRNGSNTITLSGGNGVRPTWLTTYGLSLDDGGTLTFPVTSESASRGLVTLKGVLGTVGSPVTFSCTPDTNGATIGGVSYVYPGGSCQNMGIENGASILNYTVSRIVDPAGILGSCTAAASGGTGTCAAPGADADGYR